MRTAIAILVGLVLFGGARAVRIRADDARLPCEIGANVCEEKDPPWAPSPGTAAYVTLGYREAAADWLWIRARAYVGGYDETAPGIRRLLDAVIALDPDFEPAYEFAPAAIDWIPGGPSQDDLLWCVGVLERGAARFPDVWKLPKLAGEIYVSDLKSDDPAQRTAWRERGTALLEKAIRMPGAPRQLGTYVAYLRTQLGQRDRAIAGLEELIQTTDNPDARQRLIAQLAELENADAERIDDEQSWAKEHFDRAWKRALPEAPPEMYLLLGDPPEPYIDLGELAAPPDRAAAEREALERAIGD